MSKNKKYFSLYKRNLCYKFDKILVKNLPAVQETWVQSLGQQGPLEKEMATQSSTFAWKMPWTRGWWAIVQGVTPPRGSQKLDMTWWLKPSPTLPVFHLLREKLQFKYRGGEKLLITFLACCTYTLQFSILNTKCLCCLMFVRSPHFHFQARIKFFLDIPF